MFPVLETRSGALLAAVKLVRAAIEKGIRIKIIDYPDGLLLRLVKEMGEGVEHVDLTNKYWLNSIAREDVFLGFNNDIYFYPCALKKINPRLYIYDVFPPFWGRFLRPKGIRIPFENFFLKKFFSSDFFSSGISVMENASKRALMKRFKGLNFDIHISPVSIEIKDFSYSVSSNELIRLTYIGRSVIWKLTPLAKIIRDIEASEGLPLVELRVVVSDSRRARELLKDLVQYTKKIKIIFYENLNQKELDEVILKHTDIGFAMGTSLLEFAKYGIPSVLMDFSCNSFPESYGYKWFFEAEPYSLGLDLDDPANADRAREGYSINNLINSFFLSPGVVAESCYEHASRYHSVDKNSDAILERALRSSVRARDLVSFLSCFFYLAQRIRRKRLGMRRYER